MEILSLELVFRYVNRLRGIPAVAPTEPKACVEFLSLLGFLQQPDDRTSRDSLQASGQENVIAKQLRQSSIHGLLLSA